MARRVGLAVCWVLLRGFGGRRRYVQPSARVGFHSAYSVKGGGKHETGAGNALAEAYLSRLGLSDSPVLRRQRRTRALG